MGFWSLDLGSCNSALARWNAQSMHPEMVHMPEIGRQQDSGRKIEVKYSVPSAIYAHAPRGWRDRFGAWPLIQQRMFLGRQALIGRAAIEADANQRGSGFVHGFKQALLRNSFQTMARLGERSYTPIEVARLFLREMMAEAWRVTGERPRALTIGTPVDCYEPYRAQLKQLCKSVGIPRPRFIDEPVAAALGYGLSAGHNQPVLVIDFGAGTLDLALITLDSREVEKGHCQVLAKTGAAVGGSHVDSWVLEAFCKARAFDFRPLEDPTISWWFRAMMEEARAVKERVFFEENTHFYAEPPEALRRFDALLAAGKKLEEPMPFSRNDLRDLLKERGLYTLLEQCLHDLERDALARGVRFSQISEVLMVGGSTLLPDIYPLVEKHFGRDKVRAWQPFHAVAFGGAVLASGHVDKSDFITHDYALRIYHPQTHDEQHQVIVPRGTGFPSSPHFWKRQLTPTCALGEPEKVFKMVICELGRKHNLEQEFVWDMQGRLHSSDESDSNGELVIPLNEDNPTLGYLDPPHSPSDRSARLEISFGINAERWLVATVLDLKTRKHLMKADPVVRLK